MCGIVGMWNPQSDPTATIAHARDQLLHRGPDASGLWSDPSVGIALGHTRLAIQDLSAAGSQPMVSASHRYHIVFNGEIYNQRELREQLGPQRWRGHSDTETLLACFDAWGVERALQATVGMFAFALFDSASRTLVLARDRLGEKPLYYGYAGRSLVFGSELKALRVLPGFDTTLDRGALQQFMELSYVPAPLSIYAGTLKLRPGTWLEISASQVAACVLPEPRAYWSAVEVASAADRNPLAVSDAEAVDGLERVLGQAVKGQMISDVPLGAFLSGGIDSSTVVALMQVHSSQPVRTFSIGFEEDDFDESRHASRVARHLGTDHSELTARGTELLDLVDQMPRVYDEPFADASQLPTCMVAALARKHVTVALSGDGGDELFGGYNRYFLAARNWPRLALVPRFLRRGIASGLRTVSPDGWDRLAQAYRVISPRRRVRRVGEKIHKAAQLLGSTDEEALYHGLVRQPWNTAPVLAAAMAPSAVLQPMSGLVHQMMLRDSVSYLPDDILVKVDRAAMAVSLETRVPMLDHRVFEYAWRLPAHMKVRDGVGKWVLRQVLLRHVPRELVEQPKSGFAVPISAWLRGPLRGWAEDLLDESRLRAQAYLDPVLIRRKWSEHLSGARDWQYQLWNALMFQSWLAK